MGSSVIELGMFSSSSTGLRFCTFFILLLTLSLEKTSFDDSSLTIELSNCPEWKGSLHPWFFYRQSHSSCFVSFSPLSCCHAVLTDVCPLLSLAVHSKLLTSFGIRSLEDKLWYAIHSVWYVLVSHLCPWTSKAFSALSFCFPRV